jgi:hypothetical protein
MSFIGNGSKALGKRRLGGGKGGGEEKQGADAHGAL